jgi:hypothetical protein
MGEKRTFHRYDIWQRFRSRLGADLQIYNRPSHFTYQNLNSQRVVFTMETLSWKNTLPLFIILKAKKNVIADVFLRLAKPIVGEKKYVGPGNHNITEKVNFQIEIDDSPSDCFLNHPPLEEIHFPLIIGNSAASIYR